MRDSSEMQHRLLGYVQLQVGSKVFALPIEAAPLKKPDGSLEQGGFFLEDSGSFGILVDSDASPADVQDQIQKGSAEAVKHISHKFLN